MSAANDKVIIEVGLNENQMRDANPHVPYSPDEISDDARRCADAGPRSCISTREIRIPGPHDYSTPRSTSRRCARSE